MNHWQNVDKSRDYDSTHYSVFGLIGGEGGMEALRAMFPQGEANDLNFALFSTSGVHGTYCTIEECESGEVSDVTFLIVQPRIVSLRYGNCEPRSPEDFAFLKKLRASSVAAINKAHGSAVPSGVASGSTVADETRNEGGK